MIFTSLYFVLLYKKQKIRNFATDNILKVKDIQCAR